MLVELGSAFLVARSSCRGPEPYALTCSEGGMIRLETLIELKYLNSNFSSLSSYVLKLGNQLPVEQFEAEVSQSNSIPPSLTCAPSRHIYISISLSLCVYIYIYTSIHMYIYIYTYVYIYIYIYVDLYVYMYISLSLSLYIYIYVNISGDI